MKGTSKNQMPEGVKSVIMWTVGLASIALILLIMVIIFGNLSGNVGFSPESVTITDETGYANVSGYALNGSADTGFASPVLTGLSNRTDPEFVNNENGAHINATAYTLAESTRVGFTTPVIVTVVNDSSGLSIGIGNWTLSGNTLTNATAEVWGNVSLNYTWTNVLNLSNVTVNNTGAVTNLSTMDWDNLSISYTYTRDSQGELDSQSLIQNYTLSATNTGAQFPTVGTILGISILLVILLGLLIYAITKMMAMTGGSGGSSIGRKKSIFKGTQSAEFG